LEKREGVGDRRRGGGGKKKPAAPPPARRAAITWPLPGRTDQGHQGRRRGSGGRPSVEGEGRRRPETSRFRHRQPAVDASPPQGRTCLGQRRGSCDRRSVEGEGRRRPKTSEARNGSRPVGVGGARGSQRRPQPRSRVSGGPQRRRHGERIRRHRPHPSKQIQARGQPLPPQSHTGGERRQQTSATATFRARNQRREEEFQAGRWKESRLEQGTPRPLAEATESASRPLSGFW
jgi:hypothetical protein